MSLLDFKLAGPLQPSKELLAFAERQVCQARIYEELGVYSESDRRNEHRNLIVVPVSIQPLDERFESCGDPMVAVTRDISPTAIGLFHVEPIDTGLLVIRMRLCDEDVNVVARISWCDGYGPFYRSGGKFVAKFP
jgi:hypothetical protein